MNEMKYTLRSMFIFGIVIITGIFLKLGEYYIFNLNTRVIDTYYIMCFMLVLIYLYNRRIVRKHILRKYVLTIMWLLFAFICIRSARYRMMDYQAFVRFLWYCYYIPVILVPLISMYASMLIGVGDGEKLKTRYRFLLIPAVMLIFLVLTNDLHQLTFVFPNGIEEWDSYKYGMVYVIIWGWHYVLLLFTFLIMLSKYRLSVPKKALWIPPIMVIMEGFLSLFMVFADSVRINGVLIYGFPEIYCLGIAAFWECCVQLGLIPTNTKYGTLMKQMSIPAWIASENGEVIYKSDISPDIPKEAITSIGETLPDKDTIIHSRKIHGGYGIWKEDITELNQLMDHIEEVNEALKEEAVLLRLDNERKEEQAIIEERNAVYDSISKATIRQSDQIYALSEEALVTKDASKKREIAERICFLGAYIKRYSNLMLIAERDEIISARELGLAISESLRYLERTGVVCFAGEQSEKTLQASQALAVYEIFERMIEKNLNQIKAVYAAFPDEEDVILRLTLEGIKESVLDSEIAYAYETQITFSAELEDDILYLSFNASKGGQ